MKKNLILILTFTWLVLCGCANKPINAEVVAVTEKLYEIPENCSFMEISSSNNFENECSPKLLDHFFSKFSGILINAPKEVIWPKDASLDDYPEGLMGETSGPLRLMVAGLIREKYIFMNSHGQFSKKVLLVAVNQATAQTYSGRMSSDRMMMMPPPPAAGAEPSKEQKAAYLASHANQLYSDNFNLDLVHDLGLPIANATYTIYATLGDVRSNVLTVKTKVK